MEVTPNNTQESQRSRTSAKPTWGVVPKSCSKLYALLRSSLTAVLLLSGSWRRPQGELYTGISSKTIFKVAKTNKTSQN
eukprot:1504500-Amphidinium_carterae.1